MTPAKVHPDSDLPVVTLDPPLSRCMKNRTSTLLPPMDHLSASRLNLLCSDSLDRAAELRGSNAELARRASSEGARFLAVHDLALLVQRDRHGVTVVQLPRVTLEARFGSDTQQVYLGRQDGHDFFVALLESGTVAPGEEFSDLRTLAGMLDEAQAALLGYARAMAVWHRSHRYCSHCGSTTVSRHGGHVRECLNRECGHLHYPRTDPAIIVLVEKGERALFGRKSEWPQHRYSTIAGFVEPGESAEQAVVREVAEETGVEVIRANYHSSQPWPFPGSLMLGYSAVAGNDRICRNDNELEDALWLDRQQVSEWLAVGRFKPPPVISISFRLIEDWFDRESDIPLRAVCQKTG